MHSPGQRDLRAHPLELLDPLDGWRDSGADRADPVRFRLIEALARRAAGYGGEAGRLLDGRVAALMAEYAATHAEALARAASGQTSEADAPRVAAATAIAPVAAPVAARVAANTALADLAALTERLRRRSSPEAAGLPQAHRAQQAIPAPQPLAALPAQHQPQAAAPALADSLADYFRGTWARVSVDGQLRQSQAGVPDNAGPLNTAHLVHRALSLMREVSPAYLEQFLAYVDALSWLEGMHALPMLPAREATRAATASKARSKPGKTARGAS